MLTLLNKLVFDWLHFQDLLFAPVAESLISVWVRKS
jgi:hypothetical protein